jgi:hypothetical protein
VWDALLFDGVRLVCRWARWDKGKISDLSSRGCVGLDGAYLLVEDDVSLIDIREIWTCGAHT